MNCNRPLCMSSWVSKTCQLQHLKFKSGILKTAIMFLKTAFLETVLLNSSDEIQTTPKPLKWPSHPGAQIHDKLSSFSQQPHFSIPCCHQPRQNTASRPLLPNPNGMILLFLFLSLTKGKSHVSTLPLHAGQTAKVPTFFFNIRSRPVFSKQLLYGWVNAFANTSQFTAMNEQRRWCGECLVFIIQCFWRSVQVYTQRSVIFNFFLNGLGYGLLWGISKISNM